MHWMARFAIFALRELHAGQSESALRLVAQHLLDLNWISVTQKANSQR
jgi:hypothetical protein